MFGFGAFGEAPFGALPDRVGQEIRQSREVAPIAIQGIIVPDKNTEDGVLIKSYGAMWLELVKQLSSDWSQAHLLGAEKWEQMIAGALSKAGYDEVTITPRSRDFGRDVIAVKRGFGSIKIIGSVKAYKPGHLVDYDDVRALLGVMSSELDASKGIVTTTSDFPPLIAQDKRIAPFLPTRLELMNGESLQNWLVTLAGAEQ